MPETTEGRVARVNGSQIELDLPSGVTTEVGERFTILDDSGKQIAQIKIVKSDDTGIVARQFQSFVSDDVLRRAIGAGVGAALGSLTFDPVAGAAVGAALGSVLGQKHRASICPGMRAVPSVEMERQRRELPTAEK